MGSTQPRPGTAWVSKAWPAAWTLWEVLWRFEAHRSEERASWGEFPDLRQRGRCFGMRAFEDRVASRRAGQPSADSLGSAPQPPSTARLRTREVSHESANPLRSSTRRSADSVVQHHARHRAGWDATAAAAEPAD